jgi:hypothetical protein
LNFTPAAPRSPWLLRTLTWRQSGVRVKCVGEPRLQQEMRDGPLPRPRDVGMAAHEDLQHLRPRDPAGIVQLVGIDGDLDVVSAMPWQPSISDAGNGQGWLAR